MPNMLKDLLLGVLFVCLALMLTTIGQAATVVPPGDGCNGDDRYHQT